MRRGERKEGENDAADAMFCHFGMRVRGNPTDTSRNYGKRTPQGAVVVLPDGGEGGGYAPPISLGVRSYRGKRWTADCNSAAEAAERVKFAVAVHYSKHASD